MAEEQIRRQIKYRGKTIEELQKLDVREFAKLLKSRQRRTILRNFQEIEKFVHRCKVKISRNKLIKTHCRDIIIVPELVGMKIQVYNGRQFNLVDITGDMLGHRLGEMSPTRGKVNHSKSGVGGTKGTKAKAKH